VEHDYVLLSSSEGDTVQHPAGLSTVTAFDTVLARAELGRVGKHDAIHVIYGGGYDFNCWMRDLSRDQLATVYRARFPVSLRVDGDDGPREYRVRWRPGKALWISDGLRTVTVFDVVSFFQCSFVKACDKYLGTEWHERDRIVAEKERRGTFTYAELTDIRTYNDAELVNLVRLMDELRLRLDKVGLHLDRWDGPGAIAAKLLTQRGVRHHKDKDSIPGPVAVAGRHAYAGGRFEVIRFGQSDQPVYQYDINSAYPSAMRSLPSLAGGTWSRRDGYVRCPYALYHVR
jgi:hypothetical protein